MRIDRTIDRIRRGERRAGRDVGHALVSDDDEKLGEFRARAVSVVTGDAYTQGYRDALLDVTAAYCDGYKGLSDMWPKGWDDIWASLRGGPKSPTEVATFSAMSLASASRKLSAMMEQGLVRAEPRIDGRSKEYSRVNEKVTKT